MSSKKVLIDPAKLASAVEIWKSITPPRRVLFLTSYCLETMRYAKDDPGVLEIVSVYYEVGGPPWSELIVSRQESQIRWARVVAWIEEVSAINNGENPEEILLKHGHLAQVLIHASESYNFAYAGVPFDENVFVSASLWNMSAVVHVECQSALWCAMGQDELPLA